MSPITKNGWKYWLTAIVVALVGYPLSLGPVMCVFVNTHALDWAADAVGWFYAPVGWAEQQVPEVVQQAYSWYLALWGWNPPDR